MMRWSMDASRWGFYVNTPGTAAIPSPLAVRMTDRSRSRRMDRRLRLLRGRLRQRDDHIELDPGAGRAQLVDAQRRARRPPIAEIHVHRPVHAVEITDVGQVLRDLHHVLPGGADVVEDRLD